MAIGAEKVNGLLRSAAAILEQLKSRFVQADDLVQSLDDLKRKLGVAANATTVVAAEWDQKTDGEELFAELKQLVWTLRRRNWRQLLPGRLVFVALVLLLGSLAVTYHQLHRRLAAGDQVDDAQILTVLQGKDRIEGALKEIATKQDAANQADAKRKQELEAEVGAAFDRLKTRLGEFEANLLHEGLSGHLSSSTLALWSKVVTDVEGHRASARDSFESLRKTLEPDLESLRTRYLWTDVPRRWFEIAWWAEFGTLVGLLFYVAGCLELGVFKTEELSMFVTEVLITPLVVTVVFFLFGLTGIAGFVPPESNIAQTVGFAFILGFAIRRTVGLIDLIKKRFLPDPSPVDNANS